jgi:hypothetical protein
VHDDYADFQTFKNRPCIADVRRKADKLVLRVVLYTLQYNIVAQTNMLLRASSLLLVAPLCLSFAPAPMARRALAARSPKLLQPLEASPLDDVRHTFRSLRSYEA